LKIRYSPEAAQDLLAAVEYLTERNPRSAKELYEEVRATIRRIADGELDGPETVLHTGARVRSWPVHPFRVYYRRTATALLVVRIYHHARRPLER
jgi:plasmid stabilization system protein ParE